MIVVFCSSMKLLLISVGMVLVGLILRNFGFFRVFLFSSLILNGWLVYCRVMWLVVE